MILFIIAAAIVLPLALVVYLQNPKSPTNRAYGLMSILILAWLTGVFLEDTPQEYLLLHFRTVFAAGMLMMLAWYVFTTSISSSQRFSSAVRPVTYGGIVSTLLSLTPFVVESVSRLEDSTIVPVRGPLYPVVIAWVLASIVLQLLEINDARGTADLKEKRQFRVIFIGVVLASAIALFTNVVGPAITGNTDINNLAPLGPVVLLVILAYAMLKHRFLDLKFVAARAAAYILVLVISVAGFMTTTYLILGQFTTNEFSGGTIATLGVAFTVGVLVAPLTRYFNKITDRLFYRDVYDPQRLLNEFGDVLVAEVETDRIEDASLELLTDSIRPTTSELILLKTKGEVNKWRSEGAIPDKNRRDEIEAVILAQDLQIITTSDSSGLKGVDLEVSNQLRKHGVDISMKLATKEERVGYLLLGPKKSGNNYNNQDMSFLRIMVNELSVALQNAQRFGEIKRFNETLQREIEDATGELRRTNEKLKALDEAKDEFVSMASHQLRTPLTSVKGYVSMIMEGDVGKVPPKQMEMLAAAFASSQRMVYLISDLLNVSRLRTGKFIVEPTETYLPDVVEGEVNQLLDTAKARKIKLIYDKPKEFPKLMLDETKTRQVMMNFIDNAIYYTPAGGEIVVKLKTTDKVVEYTVKDNGIGVPKAQQKDLFTKFFRADNAKKARPDGTGLGLFMAQKVIVAQGGAIVFASKKDKGSTFGFSFPLAKLKVPDKPAKEPEDKPKEDKKANTKAKT